MTAQDLQSSKCTSSAPSYSTRNSTNLVTPTSAMGLTPKHCALSEEELTLTIAQHLGLPQAAVVKIYDGFITACLAELEENQTFDIANLARFTVVNRSARAARRKMSSSGLPFIDPARPAGKCVEAMIFRPCQQSVETGRISGQPSIDKNDAVIPRAARIAEIPLSIVQKFVQSLVVVAHTELMKNHCFELHRIAKFWVIIKPAQEEMEVLDSFTQERKYIPPRPERFVIMHSINSSVHDPSVVCL